MTTASTTTALSRHMTTSAQFKFLKYKNCCQRNVIENCPTLLIVCQKETRIQVLSGETFCGHASNAGTIAIAWHVLRLRVVHTTSI